jgi:hypothetical protein
MIVTLGGKRWPIKFVNRLGADAEPLDGTTLWEADTHKSKPIAIKIKKGLSPRDELETMIHEALHACFPFLDELPVARAGRELTALLYDKFGYRKV